MPIWWHSRTTDGTEGKTYVAHAGTHQTTGSHDTAETEEARADREFASVLARLGIEMPPDLAPGVLAGHRSLQAMSRLLREVEIRDV